QKVAFMVALGLATPEHVEGKGSQKARLSFVLRRTTANPLYSGAYYEPECERMIILYIHSNTSYTPSLPDDPTWRAEAEECCCVCKRSGLLLTCDACSGLYHLECLEPPLKSTPRGVWFCQECQQQGFKKDDAMLWPETLAVVHAYIAQKTTKEEERRRLLKRSAELRCQCEATEGRVSTVGLLITKSVESRSDLVAKEDQSRTSLERLRTLLALVQDSRSAAAATT
uniref:PHD-type domain-containing protein n=1 Tax=Petromyzon marinus TaxID=7757 RepID=S4RRY4_PETMA